MKTFQDKIKQLFFLTITENFVEIFHSRSIVKPRNEIVENFHRLWRPETHFMRICLAFVDTCGGGVNCQ